MTTRPASLIPRARSVSSSAARCHVLAVLVGSAYAAQWRGPGTLHLLVRQTRRTDGSPGLASGWLTAATEHGLPLQGRVMLEAGARLGQQLPGAAVDGRPRTRVNPP